MRFGFMMVFAAAGVLALPAPPVQAQFGGLFPRDAQNVVNDATNENGCGEKKKSSAGSRVLGGILGRTARNAAGQAGISSWVPIGEVTDQLSTAIACRLDPEEQKQAADATLRATRSTDGEGEDTAPEPVPVGSSASWTSGTREEVSGTSTVTGRIASAEGADCITVTDVIIVKGEETTADKRMCRPPGSRRYSLVA
jgi:surface antigen